MKNFATVILTWLAYLKYGVGQLKVFSLGETDVFSHGDGSVFCYRIPIVFRTAKGTIIVATEARKLTGRWTCDDKGPKFIAIRRSTDGGSSWEPMQYVFDDPGPDGLNLGVIFEEDESHTIFIQFTHHFFAPRNTIAFITSIDEGRTWNMPRNVSKEIGTFSFIGGPGYGIKKRLAPHAGRLLFCGHSDIPTDGVYLLYSDDGGKTWHWGAEMPGIPYGRGKRNGDFNPDECQIYEDSNGDVVTNARNQNHFHAWRRIRIVSKDGGDSFSNRHVFLEDQLPDSAVSASILREGNLLFFSNPHNERNRINMTLCWSEDGGKSWKNKFRVWSQGSGYSGLVSIKPRDEMGFGVLGLVFEKGPDASTYWHSVAFVKIGYEEH